MHCNNNLVDLSKLFNLNNKKPQSGQQQQKPQYCPKGANTKPTTTKTQKRTPTRTKQQQQQQEREKKNENNNKSANTAK